MDEKLEEARAIYERGYKHLEDGDYDKAIADCTAALEIFQKFI